MTFLTSVSRAIAASFVPLQDALQSPAAFALFLEELGWDVDLNDSQFGTMLDALQVVGQIDDIVALADSDAEAGELVVQVAQAAAAIYSAFSGLSSDSITNLPQPLSDTSFWGDLALALPEHLTLTYLQGSARPFFEMLHFTGVITRDPESVNGVVRYHLMWSKLGELLADPLSRLRAEYGWGSTFDHVALLDRLLALGNSLGVALTLNAPGESLLQSFFAPAAVPADFKQLTALLYEGYVPETSAWLRTGLLLLPVPATPQGAISALYLSNLTLGKTATTIKLNENALLTLSGSVDNSGAIGLLLQPGEPAAFTALPPQLDWSTSLEITNTLPLIGEADGMRLEFDGVRLTLELRGTPQSPEFVISVATIGEGLQTVIATGEGDNFIQELLGSSSLSAGTNLEINWSSKTGLSVFGGAALDLIVPLNLRLLALTIYQLHLRAMYQNERFELIAGVDTSAELGVFTLSVSDIGLIVSAQPSDEAGSFAGLAIGLDFKPPGGAGVGFDFLGIVYGGGFIGHDPDKGEYSGIITVELLAIGITATVIITTQLPDDPDGWSLFISINVDLGGIPLGFGFTLNKVGGLIGVHRTIDTAALQAGIRTGILDSILFPDNPIANAPQILNDMEAAFPAAQGSFVVGAMLQIGWGTPSIITADLGLIIQVPDVIIALIGQAEAMLPFDDFALIEVHFDVLGILDLTAGTLAIDAGLRDSRIVGYVMTGQMALRASFLTEPSFLLSLGGFHPAFVPPESFPTLARIGFGLSLGGWLNISLEAYLALTSNTVQFGAGLYLTASLAGFRIEGGTEINTLIQFSPFQFQANLRYYITVSAASIELLGVLLTGELKGPNPYYVRGTAHFKLFGLQKEVDIEETIGSKSPLDDIDDVPVLTDVVAALENPQNWRAVDEGGRISAVLLAAIEDPTAEVVVHPGGLVEVVQRVAPLDVELEHYGNTEIDGEDTFDIDDVKAGGSSIAWEFVEDWFAPAQFFDLSEDEKLSAPSFEKMKGGLRLGDDEADAGPRADTIYDYKQIIHDPEFEVPSLTLDKSFRPQTLNLSDLQAQIVTVFDRKGPVSSRSVPQAYQLNPARYVLVERDTLTTRTGTSTPDMTYAEARQTMRANGAAEQIVVTSSERQTP